MEPALSHQAVFDLFATRMVAGLEAISFQTPKTLVGL
jgi:hypothetical protein